MNRPNDRTLALAKGGRFQLRRGREADRWEDDPGGGNAG